MEGRIGAGAYFTLHRFGTHDSVFPTGNVLRMSTANIMFKTTQKSDLFQSTVFLRNRLYKSKNVIVLIVGFNSLNDDC